MLLRRAALSCSSAAARAGEYEMSVSPSSAGEPSSAAAELLVSCLLSTSSLLDGPAALMLLALERTGWLFVMLLLLLCRSLKDREGEGGSR